MAMPDEDLDFAADLEAALDGNAKPEAAPLGQQEAQPEQETTEEEAERLYRRDGRRFVPKEDEKAAKDAKPEGEAPAPAKAWKPLWYKDEYGNWDQLSEPLRKALEQREKESAKAIEERSVAAKQWEPLNEAIRPYEAQLRAQGQTPQQFVGGLVQIYSYLQQDPVQALNWLAQNTLGAGWDIRSLADWMDQQGVQAQRVDPVQQELATLKNELAALRAAPQQQYQQSVSQTVSKWSEDKPYFGELQSTIYGLIQADPSVKERFRVDPKATLDSLYEQAQWAHPQIRQRILEDQRKAEVTRARAAGSQSPRGVPQPNGAPRTPKQNGKWNIESDIAEVFDELGIQ
jgi:hypothetical protein